MNLDSICDVDEKLTTDQSIEKQPCIEIRKARYRELQLYAINEGLASVLGEKSNLVFLCLRSVLFLKKERICDEPEVFHLGLKSLFGSSASFVEQNILNTFCSKLNLSHFSKDAFLVSLRRIRNYCLFRERAKS